MTHRGVRNLLRIQDYSVRPGRPDDFNTNGERTATSQYHLVDTPSYIQGSNIFVNNIESRLPYYETISVDAFPHTAFMIDDERIIGLKVRYVSTGSIPKLIHYRRPGLRMQIRVK